MKAMIIGATGFVGQHLAKKYPMPFLSDAVLKR